MTVKLAIFDFDGTLANTYPVFADSLNALAIKHGFRQVAYDEQCKLRSMSAVEVLREVELPLWKVPAVLSDFRKIMRQRINEIRPFSGMASVLHTIMQERVAVAIATSNSIDNVKAVLGDSLIDRFAAVECSSTLFGKSHRLRRILKKTQADKAETIYIGDEIRDAEAAERAGVSFGAVAWGYTAWCTSANESRQRFPRVGRLALSKPVRSRLRETGHADHVSLTLTCDGRSMLTQLQKNPNKTVA
jgi:phosphoglycolate phosphatase